MMLSIRLGLIALALSFACGARQTRPTRPIDPAITQFLVTTAAKDFQTHASSYPARFQSVRVGYIEMPDGERQYMLCGRFLPRQKSGEDWTAFVTIKAGDYEQWIGAPAASRCQQSSITWANDDLSSSLQSALDSPH